MIETTPVVERPAKSRANHEIEIRRIALLRTMPARLALLSHDELRVIDTLVDRILKVGRESYAPLDLSRDERDWKAEAASEHADALFYLLCDEVSKNDARRERLYCEAADELAAVSASLAGGCSCRHPHVPCLLHETSIAAGLAELVANAPDEMPEWSFDLGGEGGP